MTLAGWVGPCRDEVVHKVLDGASNEGLERRIAWAERDQAIGNLQEGPPINRGAALSAERTKVLEMDVFFTLALLQGQWNRVNQRRRVWRETDP